MIKLQAKRFELNFLLKFSDLKSNFTLTLGYLNPALNNPGLICKFRGVSMASGVWERMHLIKDGGPIVKYGVCDICRNDVKFCAGSETRNNVSIKF